jgi:hypothetical protein
LEQPLGRWQHGGTNTANHPTLSPSVTQFPKVTPLFLCHIHNVYVHPFSFIKVASAHHFGIEPTLIHFFNSAWFAFLLPCYATFKALSNRPLSEPDLHKLSMYWATIGAFVAFEYTLEWTISWYIMFL